MAKDSNFLGVDIGASSVKIVEIANDNGRARLVTYGYTEHQADISDEDVFSPEKRGKELADLCKEAGVSTKRAITGLPMSSVFSTIFTFPEGSEKQLEEMIRSKAQKLSPIPTEDLVLDWKKMSASPEEKIIKFSVTAASKKMINNYVQIFKIAGLELLSLETEALAMVRSLLGKDQAPSIIVDIGAVKTNVLVIKEGVPVIHRTVKAGGQDITAVLSSKMKIDLKKAEEVKRNLSLAKLEGVENLLQEVLEPIVNEVKYCQNLHTEQYNHSQIEKLVLTGGSAHILGMPEVLRQASGLRVFVGDPWARIIYPDDLRPVLDKIGPYFSVAIGLSMRDI
ncbi:MAG: type IV pilus assembly protein PilM [Patescibacteria group bacterium]